ncbi:MAG: outer membrane beta-barrel protein [Bacteroidota bacterium]
MRNLFLLSLGLLVSGMAGAQSTYSPWSLEFYGSPQWSQYSNRSETATFLVAGAAEGEVFSFSTGLLVRRQLRPRWLLDAGLGLHLASESWSVASREEASAGGGLNQSPTLTASGNRRVDYVFLELPWALRYYWKNGDRWRVYARAGAQVDLRLATKVVTVSEASTLAAGNEADFAQSSISLSSEAELASVPAFNYGVLLGLGLEWKVASRWSLLFEPEGQLRLRANTGGQRRYRWGTRLGLVLYFGRS